MTIQLAVSEYDRYVAWRTGNWRLDTSHPINSKLVLALDMSQVAVGSSSVEWPNNHALPYIHGDYTASTYDARTVFAHPKHNNMMWYSGIYGSIANATYTQTVAAEFQSSAFSVSLWFLYDGTSIGIYDGFFGHTNTSSWTVGCGIYYEPSPDEIVAFAGNWSTNETGRISLSDDTWYNVVLTCDGTNGYLYNDGAFVASAASGTTNNNNPIDIGMVGTTNYQMPGVYYSDVRYWTRCLDPAEIKTIYDRPWAHVVPVSQKMYQYAADLPYTSTDNQWCTQGGLFCPF